MVLLLVLTAGTPTGAHFINGARNFGRHFQSLESARGMNPIERILLSFMLAS